MNKRDVNGKYGRIWFHHKNHRGGNETLLMCIVTLFSQAPQKINDQIKLIVIVRLKSVAVCGTMRLMMSVNDSGSVSVTSQST